MKKGNLMINEEKQFNKEQTLTAQVLAERWGVSPKTLANMRYRRKGPAFWKIGGRILYDLNDVIRQEQNSFHTSNETR